MPFRSYLTQLCRKRVIKTWTNERKTKRGANCKFWSATVIPARHNISCLARITGPLTCLTKTCRYGDKILSGKMSPEQQNVTMAGMKFQNPCFPRSYVAMATNVLPAEKRRFEASGWWRGRNPLAKKADVAIATKILPGKKAKFCKSIKSSLLISETLLSDLRSFYGEKNRGKHRETLKQQGAQGLKGFTRSLRHHGLLPFHLFFSPCKVTMTMSS